MIMYAILKVSDSTIVYNMSHCAATHAHGSGALSLKKILGRTLRLCEDKVIRVCGGRSPMKKLIGSLRFASGAHSC